MDEILLQSKLVLFNLLLQKAASIGIQNMPEIEETILRTLVEDEDLLPTIIQLRRFMVSMN